MVICCKGPSYDDHYDEGSSAFGICLVTILDDKICVLETVELYRQQFDDCINKVSEVMLKENHPKVILMNGATFATTLIRKNIFLLLRTVTMYVLPVNGFRI
jgi:hypothetical protein